MFRDLLTTSVALERIPKEYQLIANALVVAYHILSCQKNPRGFVNKNEQKSRF